MTEQSEIGGELDPAGCWVELLGPVRGHVVAVVDATGGPGDNLLRDRGAQVRRLDPAGLARVEPGSCDAVVLAGVARLPDLIEAAAKALTPAGVLLVVLANPLSPLAWWDALSRRRVPAGGSVRRLRRRLGRWGLSPVLEYGLLRSIEAPSTSFSLGHPAHAALVLAASNTLNSGSRRRAVAALSTAARAGLAGPLVPGLALLCSARPLRFDPVLGRIGYLGSWEAKLLVGDPLREIVKVYGSAAPAAAEADALDDVDRVWPGLAPRVLARESELRTRLSWAPGRTLAVSQLDDAAAQRWLVAAAALLGRLHRLLGPAPDGTVLLHGDYWLGNLLVDRDEEQIVGVIDWTEAHRGPARDDLRFLVDAWAGPLALDVAGVDRVRRLVEQAYAAALHG